MARALELARRGVALAHPNPVVGAVLVKRGRKIGEGFHVYAKRDHAEIVALRQAGDKARGATLYVTLEPCCTTGRTGPCTKAIIAAGVTRVVAAMNDPNPAVAGRGFAELKRAGVKVALGIGEESARQLNQDFARWIRTGLPFVTLKAALTLDGQIAQRAGSATLVAVMERKHFAQKRNFHFAQHQGMQAFGTLGIANVGKVTTHGAGDTLAQRADALNRSTLCSAVALSTCVVRVLALRTVTR